MRVDEFSLIAAYFNIPALQPCKEHIVLGNGDDAAVIAVPSGQWLVQSMDAQVADIHFPAGASADRIGYRALAASVSDLAAMGAKPHSFSLSLTLPEMDHAWLNHLSAGMVRFATEYHMTLLGGDLTKGPSIVLAFHVQGFVDADKVLRRSGARLGDRIFVSGTLGDAGGGLPLVQQCSELPLTGSAQDILMHAYYEPKPQWELGRWLLQQGVQVAIDISDGLLADLQHILDSSGVGAHLDRKKLPLSDALCVVYSLQDAQTLALSSGDDYQLCFCWPADRRFPYEACPTIVTEIGKIVSSCGITDEDGTCYKAVGFNHFLKTSFK